MFLQSDDHIKLYRIVLERNKLKRRAKSAENKRYYYEKMAQIVVFQAALAEWQSKFDELPTFETRAAWDAIYQSAKLQICDRVDTVSYFCVEPQLKKKLPKKWRTPEAIKELRSRTIKACIDREQVRQETHIFTKHTTKTVRKLARKLNLRVYHGTGPGELVELYHKDWTLKLPPIKEADMKFHIDVYEAEQILLTP